MSSRRIAVPAAPAPDITIRTSLRSLPTTRSAFVSAASTTIAVPCWSSWKTGMSRMSRSRRSISKQRGAEMSSRLMPAKPGDTARTISTIRSGSWVSRHSGQASMPAKRLNSAALPSITGRAAAGPMLPEAEDGGAVGDDRDGVPLHGEPAGVLGVRDDRLADARDTGGVDHRQVVAVADRVLALHLDGAAEVHQERAVGDLVHVDALDRPERLDDAVGMRGVGSRTGHVDAELVVARRGDVEGGDDAAGLLDAGREPADRGAAGGQLEPDGDGVGDARFGGHVHIVSCPVGPTGPVAGL